MQCRVYKSCEQTKHLELKHRFHNLGVIFSIFVFARRSVISDHHRLRLRGQLKQLIRIIIINNDDVIIVIHSNAIEIIFSILAYISISISMNIDYFLVLIYTIFYHQVVIIIYYRRRHY